MKLKFKGARVYYKKQPIGVVHGAMLTATPYDGQQVTFSVEINRLPKGLSMKDLQKALSYNSFSNKKSK
jgi:hypothetical protein